MAIDYDLQMPCEVRKSMPEAKLLAMVRHLEIAEFAIEKLKVTEPKSDMNAILNNYKIEIAVNEPDGTAREMPVTIAQILAMVAPLENLKHNCAPCRANVSDRNFGCIAKINYPVSTEAEEWLLARLPDDVKSPSLSLLFKFLADLEIDGSPVDSFRNRPKMFVSKSSAVRTWGGWFDKKKISSSQLLHMLAFGGTIGPEQAQLYTKLFNLSSILSESHPPSPQIEQFKTFFCAIVMAGRLNAKILVDY